jgi:hypothetical protein
MAFGKNTTLTLVALVSAAALVTAACTTETDPDDGTGGSGTSSGGNGTGGNGTGATSSGGNGTGGMGTGGMGTGGMAETDCETYCTNNLANCSDTNKQWDTADQQATCEAWCTIWDQGTPGDMQGDTLECRAYHTGAAASDAATHCPHAGPLGGGVCGASNCEVFCAAMQLFCTGQDAEYADEAACRADCNTLADATDPYTADSSLNATDNPNQGLACRAYHLSAAIDDPGTHCQHAAGVSLCP